MSLSEPQVGRNNLKVTWALEGWARFWREHPPPPGTSHGPAGRRRQRVLPEFWGWVPVEGGSGAWDLTLWALGEPEASALGVSPPLTGPRCREVSLQPGLRSAAPCRGPQRARRGHLARPLSSFPPPKMSSWGLSWEGTGPEAPGSGRTLLPTQTPRELPQAVRTGQHGGSDVQETRTSRPKKRSQKVSNTAAMFSVRRKGGRERRRQGVPTSPTWVLEPLSWHLTQQAGM